MTHVLQNHGRNGAVNESANTEKYFLNTKTKKRVGKMLLEPAWRWALGGSRRVIKTNAMMEHGIAIAPNLKKHVFHVPSYLESL